MKRRRRMVRRTGRHGATFVEEEVFPTDWRERVIGAFDAPPANTIDDSAAWSDHAETLLPDRDR
jgi:hypothetical protein